MAPKLVAAARSPVSLRMVTGRWALPSGATFSIYWADEAQGLVWCGNGVERWRLTSQEMTVLLEGKQLRYLGPLKGRRL